ncbi:hypothetical protein B0H17DRAFT_1086605 [Mycena rosella]|uniref:Uncharacterized protein n=1 Tax=Mycena rosella TaxID=1033263 RepID=A0AAD7CZ71_MYCRO|nr:hypothetical protein B0H17DRAFT_1086605 [Mycena rosella]
MSAFSARNTIQSTTQLFDISWDLTMQTFEETGVSLVLYGIYICLFLLSLNALSRRKARGTKLLIGATCAMAVVGTAAMAINIALAVLTARTTQQIVHEQVAQFLNGLRYQETLAEALVITSLTNNFLTDSLFLYRCYVIWGSQKKIIILPGLLMIGTVATGFLSVVSVSFQDAKITYGLAAATNVVLTALTAGRILWMRRDASHIPVDKTLRPRYNMAIRLTLESGVIYCIAAIVLLITSFGAAKIGSAAETSNVIGGGFFQSLLNIIPTFTLVYVGRIAADIPEDRNFSASSTRIPRRLVGRQTLGPAGLMEIGPKSEEKESGEV